MTNEERRLLDYEEWRAENSYRFTTAKETVAAYLALPTIEEMSGLVKNFTEGIPLSEYMEMLSNE